MKPCLCQDCAQPMTVEEVLYYENRCETCTRAWSDRIGKWMSGETIEPELDRFFAGPRVELGLKVKK
jgi:hypothetical protein